MSKADINKQQTEKELKVRIKKEVIEQLKIESLKKEIVNEIQGKRAKFSFAKISQHPVFLVVIGFVLTGLIGNQIASWWQRREWDRQQTRLVQIRSIEQKYGVIDEISKAIGEHNSAAQYIIATVTRDLNNDVRLNKELPEISKNWDTARSDWRTSSSILRQKIVVYIKNKEVGNAFDRIMNNRRALNADFLGWIEELNNRKLKIGNDLKNRTEAHITIYTHSYNETSDEFERIAALIVKEIQATVEGQ